MAFGGGGMDVRLPAGLMFDCSETKLSAWKTKFSECTKRLGRFEVETTLKDM